jgi:hypothetical protein
MRLGDPIYLDFEKLPDLVIITKEEADAYADKFPKRQFIITNNKSDVKKVKS